MLVSKNINNDDTSQNNMSIIRQYYYVCDTAHRVYNIRIWKCNEFHITLYYICIDVQYLHEHLCGVIPTYYILCYLYTVYMCVKIYVNEYIDVYCGMYGKS